MQSKIQRYAGNELARNIVGQPRTTIDPRAWVRDGAIVIVDAAKSRAGEDTCALVGAALINFVGLALVEQGHLPPSERRRVTLALTRAPRAAAILSARPHRTDSLSNYPDRITEQQQGPTAICRGTSPRPRR